MKKLMELPKVETAFHRLMLGGDFAASDLPPPRQPVLKSHLSRLNRKIFEKKMHRKNSQRFFHSDQEGENKVRNIFTHQIDNYCFPPDNDCLIDEVVDNRSPFTFNLRKSYRQYIVTGRA